MSLGIATYSFYGFITSGFWALAATPITSLGAVTGPLIAQSLQDLLAYLREHR
jgi:hypothetical protein